MWDLSRQTTGLSVLYRGFRFYLVLDFWLAWATTGLPVLFVHHVNDTGTGWESIPLGSSLSGVSHLLDVVVGEVDELEEDVGQFLSCLEGVIEVEG